MWKRLLVAVLVTGLACCQPEGALARKDTGPAYAGLEFFGSTLLTRSEAEKDLALKPGADAEATLKAVNRLKQRLSERRVEANIDVVTQADKLFITLDVVDPSGNGIPVRKMVSQRRIFLTSALPFSLLDQLFARIQTLRSEGRPAAESIADGIKQYADEPCNQFAKKLSELVPPMRGEFLSVINYDPDPVKRSKAVEVLNWDPHWEQNCATLIPIMDDGAEQVRASVSRFIYPRIAELPDNFPLSELTEVVSHQLQRPSHIDRLMALRCLNEISRTHPFSTRAILEADSERLRQLASESLLSSIKSQAQQLLDSASKLPELPKPKKQVHINEF